MILFLAPPNLEEMPQDYALFGIEDVVFTCKFRSLPEATVTWTYFPENGGSTQLASGAGYMISSEVMKGQDYIFVTSNLTVLRAVRSNAGRYVCNATNNVPNYIEAVSYGMAQIFAQDSSK